MHKKNLFRTYINANVFLVEGFVEAVSAEVLLGCSICRHSIKVLPNLVNQVTFTKSENERASIYMVNSRSSVKTWGTLMTEIL